MTAGGDEMLDEVTRRQSVLQLLRRLYKYFFLVRSGICIFPAPFCAIVINEAFDTHTVEIKYNQVSEVRVHESVAMTH